MSEPESRWTEIDPAIAPMMVGAIPGTVPYLPRCLVPVVEIEGALLVPALLVPEAEPTAGVTAWRAITRLRAPTVGVVIVEPPRSQTPTFMLAVIGVHAPTNEDWFPGISVRFVDPDSRVAPRGGLLAMTGALLHAGSIARWLTSDPYWLQVAAASQPTRVGGEA